MNTDKLLGMLIEAIDYSFLQSNGDYDKSLTYPVIDKVKYIKEKLKNNVVKDVNMEKETEDEKVKRILHSISSKMSFHLCDIFTEEEFQCFDTWSNIWLKNQRKQKPPIEMITPEESLDIDSETYNKIVDECIYGEQKPAWNEDDEEKFRDVIRLIEQGAPVQSMRDHYINWLKSLKEKIKI